MANRPDIPEGGRIQCDQTSPVRNVSIGYNDNIRHDKRLGASMDSGSHPPAQDKALHDAIALNVGCRRDNNNEVLPTDPLDERIREK